MIAKVASQAHNLEVEGSTPSPATIYNIKDMEEKQMKVLTAKNVRILINQVNELKIQKENIVSLQFNDGQYLLIYYGV